jgi:hypothetical protein
MATGFGSGLRGLNQWALLDLLFTLAALATAAATYMAWRKFARHNADGTPITYAQFLNQGYAQAGDGGFDSRASSAAGAQQSARQPTILRFLNSGRLSSNEVATVETTSKTLGFLNDGGFDRRYAALPTIAVASSIAAALVWALTQRLTGTMAWADHWTLLLAALFGLTLLANRSQHRAFTK